MQSPVSYDLILYILSFLADKSQILYRLALVNREFNQAASKILYAQVILCPSYHHIAPNLKDNGLLTEPSQFISAKLPRYSSFVERLHIAGFLSTRAPPNNKLHAALCKAVQSFTHLQSVSFTPVSYHEDIFVESLKIIQKRSTLEELTVNRSCFDEPNITNPMSSSGLATLGEEDEEQEEQEREPPITKTQLLASFRNLIKLSLHDPTRAILQALIPGWLDALSGTLTDLHLMASHFVFKLCTYQDQAKISAGKLWLNNTWRVEIGYTTPRKDLFIQHRSILFAYRSRCLQRLVPAPESKHSSNQLLLAKYLSTSFRSLAPTSGPHCLS
ncbi:hypothetical protein WG66_010115 [Moniliophthora roreri]|nr:hypothetical protein WG66_010115 [Moniliophthora roreri]